VFLLFLHLSEHSVFFDLDEIATLFLREMEPKLLYTFAFLGRAGAPYLIVGLGRRLWIGRGTARRVGG
jgi:hypothetical protein